MRDDFGARRQPIMRILVIGLMILFISIAVSISMISVLKLTYSQQVSEDFQDHHISSGEKLDGTIEIGIEIVQSAAQVMGNVAPDANGGKIFEVLNDYNEFSTVDELSFVNADNEVYYHNRVYFEQQLGEQFQDFLTRVRLMHASTKTVTAVVMKDNAPHIQIISPVRDGNAFCGYLVATIQVEGIFDRQEYNYQNTMGECYLIDQVGNILSKSSDSDILPCDEINFYTTLAAYSDELESNKKVIFDLQSALENSRDGFVTVTTKNAESLQISFYTLKSIDCLYFISCYNDNLVEDKVQPLIFRSVLSCIIIIVLMIGIIVYVWANAKRANITIEKLAYGDPVTKGKNINYFKEFAVNIMSVFKETPFVIYRFDIANFRYINEAYGHIRADEILGAVISNFAEIFSEKELCVRMNADQFLAIIENDKTVGQRLDQLSKKVNEEARGRGIKYPIRFKIGIYQIRKHDHDIDEMIDRANVARKTLNTGDDENIAYYTERIVQDMRKLDRIESDMQRALANGEFKVFLQPKWDIYQNRIAGAEALVRWMKSDGTLIYPDEFIPIFENNGFIEKLDFYMLESVCQMLRALIDAGRRVYPVSVNQSRMLLHSADYTENVARIIEKYKLPPNILELEITETVFMDERDNMVKVINELKKCGVRLAMDDFGSGYSSLNMLKDVYFDTIKIDREFFVSSTGNERNQWILLKIIELSNGVGMEVVCEGVETAEQVQLLGNLGCRLVQGYFYSKPISAEDFVEKFCPPVVPM